MESVILLVIVGVLVLGGIIWKAKMSLARSKPMHLREPIPKGCFRLAALDDLGDDAILSRAIDDYPTMEEAFQKADEKRKEAEFRAGAAGKQKGKNPTKFLVYNDQEKVMNPDPPPSGAQAQ